uniref:Ig-like domain-containing protein n=1 Tax=Monopterus albus TaxID=43700 RepID=A0A3Q3J0X9_MONAL
MLTARAKRSVFGGFPTHGCLFLIVTLLSGETLGNGVSEKIRASAGGTVVLPCHISHSSDIPTVEWSKEGLNPNIAFLYRQGCETFEMKNPVFEFRTNLIMNEVIKGDISLHMSNVQLSDAGIYQCRVIWERNPEVLKTLELIVVAVSVPNLSFIPNAGSGVTLQCETNCWSPAPQITFLDNQGNNISAEDARRDQDSTGCFRVTKRVTVPAATERVTCRVHQPQINETRDTEIYIPGTLEL